MRAARRLVALGSLLAALASPSASMADEAPAVSAQDKARAMQKFEDGSRAFDQKRYKDAIDLFLEADRLVQHPAFACNASLAYEAMGDVAAALRWAREYLFRSPAAEDRAQLEAQIKRYESRLREKGVQQVTVRSTPTGATVLVDGAPVGVTPWTGEIIPGAHKVELRRRGYVDADRALDLPTDRAVELHVELKPQADTPPSTPITPTAAVDAGADEAPPWLLPLSIGVLAAGAAGGGVAVALEVLRGNEADAAREAATQLEAANHAAKMDDYQLGARIAAGVGGGLALVGATLLVVDFTAFDSAPQTTASASCGSAFCGLTLTGTFR